MGNRRTHQITLMPLTPFQAGIAGILARNRTPESHLAGGGALHIHPAAL